MTLPLAEGAREMGAYRVFVEKKPGFATEAQSLRHDLNETLHLDLDDVRVINVYDMFNVSAAAVELAKNAVLSEVVTDHVSDALDLAGQQHFAVEFLPGQYDQRADSAMQCLALLGGADDAVITSGKVLVFDGISSPDELSRIRDYVINPVEMREKDMSAPLALPQAAPAEAVPVISGFTKLSAAELADYLAEHGMAMSLADAQLIQRYFGDTEHRDPTETELRVLDTYWSDHCRHTTFETLINKVTFEPGRFHDLLQNAFTAYCLMRERVHGGAKPMTLMDLATIGMKAQRAAGTLADLEVSDEINACSIFIDVEVEDATGERRTEPWLLMFKNETHNHPTEIEPFGGASTCIGGAIRDPLSGRSYVYQAMRISGGADICEPIEATIDGKLPQKVISRGAAHGNSSYGNQIGLATSFVKELFHPGYKAKHLEVGAVVGAAKASDVVRLTPQPGDAIILLGGATGRDGIGGATGSSKVHTTESVTTASSEVQKGNAPIERKIQRLFRNPDVTRLIKKCNDFGAGGVCVAIGELADGVAIDLNAVPIKYQGLSGTELAISESQERMAVVVAPEDVAAFQAQAARENLSAVVVAQVTDDRRLTMTWNGEEIVDISRDFLDTNGAKQQIEIIVPTNPTVQTVNEAFGTWRDRLLETLASPNVASRQGMVEMFDSSIGAGTVLMPYGGKYQLTEAEGSVHKLPVLDGTTDTASILTYGYDPQISAWSPFHGAVSAVVDSVAKVVAMGGDWHGIRFSFQEYFERLGTDPRKWAQPFSALLGALYAQTEFGLPAIGGKDSMSGTFHELTVPPTLISFAVQVAAAGDIISPEFKQPGDYVYLLDYAPRKDALPNLEELKQNFDFVHQAIGAGQIDAAFCLKQGGIAEAVAKMSFGNKIGVALTDDVADLDLFTVKPGALVVAASEPLEFARARLIGRTTSVATIALGDDVVTIDDAIAAWQGTYGGVYPVTAPRDFETSESAVVPNISYNAEAPGTALLRVAKPQVFLPVFPGTNCEYDTARAFNAAGAEPIIDVFRNSSATKISESIDRMASQIDASQILMLSGGFSAGDEPDGSGKFIASVLQNEQVRASIEGLLERGGLILGICNGFQALIKSGLLPYGEFGRVTADSPTLVRNDSNRHVSKIVRTRIASTLSPWLRGVRVGDLHNVAISSGEGKFVASDAALAELIANGQVATQYVDLNGRATMDGLYNPNGSTAAIEGITSPDGRILGKMAHSERWVPGVFRNVVGNYDQQIFTSGVNYFTGSN